MWFRTHASPVWHEAAPSTLKGCVSAACSAVSNVEPAHVREEPPRGSSCKVCAEMIASDMRGELRVLTGGREGASEDGFPVGVEPANGGQQATPDDRSGQTMTLRAEPSLRPSIAPAAGLRSEPMAVDLRSLPPMIDARQCADICGVSDRTWHRWNSAGQVPEGQRVGPKTRRWRTKDVLEWLGLAVPAEKRRRR